MCVSCMFILSDIGVINIDLIMRLFLRNKVILSQQEFLANMKKSIFVVSCVQKWTIPVNFNHPIELY